MTILRTNHHDQTVSRQADQFIQFRINRTRCPPQTVASLHNPATPATLGRFKISFRPFIDGATNSRTIHLLLLVQRYLLENPGCRHQVRVGRHIFTLHRRSSPRHSSHAADLQIGVLNPVTPTLQNVQQWCTKQRQRNSRPQTEDFNSNDGNRSATALNASV